MKIITQNRIVPAGRLFGEGKHLRNFVSLYKNMPLNWADYSFLRIVRRDELFRERKITLN
jgi:hypothetical protein